MLINYVCLDDEAEKVKPITQLLEQSNTELKINVCRPSQFDEAIREISKKSLDGLMIDLRLDRVVGENGLRVNYRALSLAQELRTRMTEAEIKPFPIVLWSVDDNFKASYTKDETSHDLFDRQYYKASITQEKAVIANEMVALSKGYQKINEFKRKRAKHIYCSIIALQNAFDILDERIAGEIAEDRSYPTHIFARSILQHLIFGSGPLVDEQVLAARLGVDIKQSNDWVKLKAKFAAPAAYAGVFHEAWPRWWMFMINAEWKKIHPDSALQRLEAKERVQILKKAFRLSNLVAATPIAEGYDSRYWHVCKLLHKPISPSDAVQLAANRKEWQDGIYASLKAVLERRHKSEGYEIHSFERPRIEELMVRLRRAQK